MTSPPTLSCVRRAVPPISLKPPTLPTSKTLIGMLLIFPSSNWISPRGLFAVHTAAKSAEDAPASILTSATAPIDPNFLHLPRWSLPRTFPAPALSLR
jgi:hypothetical protein